ncbi:hypothetical protein RQN30_02630 [Arcanobacterium hippocoleae]
MQAHQVLLSQSHEIAQRLRFAGFRARTIAVKIRTGKFETITRSRTLSVPTELGSEIYREALRLFSKGSFPDSGIRLLGVRADNLQSAQGEVQGVLGADQRSENAERAIDAVKQRYGAQALSFAALCRADDVRENYSSS